MREIAGKIIIKKGKTRKASGRTLSLKIEKKEEGEGDFWQKDLETKKTFGTF